MRFTWSTNALNECGSFTANSASTFLSTHTFSEPSACMNSLYLTCTNENKRERSRQSLYVVNPTCLSSSSSRVTIDDYEYRRSIIRVDESIFPRTPCSLVAALILVIQSLRYSRFFVRRSRYWYCHALCTRSRAVFMQFFARPRNPLAAAKILSRTAIVRSHDVRSHDVRSVPFVPPSTGAGARRIVRVES